MTEPDAPDLPHVLYDDLPMARDRGVGWATLRDLGPVVHGDGWYYLTRREDVLAALRNPEVFSSTIAFDDMISPVPLIPLGFDPPEHTRYRRILHPFFSPQTLGALLPSLQAQAIDIIEPIAAATECEVMAELATPYPSQVFLTLFGLPLQDRERLIAWKDAIIAISLTSDPDRRRPHPRGGAVPVSHRGCRDTTGRAVRRRPVAIYCAGDDPLTDTEAVGLALVSSSPGWTPSPSTDRRDHAGAGAPTRSCARR